jgi:aryl-alcohol dehydrogenase-like predicted oxidoreductase
MEQPEYNMFKRERVEIEYRTLYRDYGLGLTIWSPLASGVLTGKYSGFVLPPGSRLALDAYAWLRDRKFQDQRTQVEKTDLLVPLAARLGCSLAQLAIAWCLKNDNVSTVILGATKISQVGCGASMVCWSTEAHNRHCAAPREYCCAGGGGQADARHDGGD